MNKNKVKQRSDEEITGIYHRHADTVYRVCFMFMKNKYDTEDMTQNVFLRLMSNNVVFESEEHEKAWLIKTAGNLCKDFFKSIWSKTVYIEERTDSQIPFPEETGEIFNLVHKLPQKYKIPLYLHYFEGYKAAEIAAMLKKPESTVYGYLHRGRKLLKMELEAGENE